MISVVVKPFTANGEELESGQVVDSSRWRNEGRLINCRFLREATESEVIAFKAPAAKKPAPKTKTKTATVTKTAQAATPSAKKKAAKTAPKKTTRAAAPAKKPAGNDHVSL